MPRASKLASRRCVPCKKGTPPLGRAEIEELHEQLGGGWQVVNQHHLEKLYRFDNFLDALAFTVRVGELAEDQSHHPDIHLSWGKVVITIWTHVVDGLSESDFVLAAKADRLVTPR